MRRCGGDAWAQWLDAPRASSRSRTSTRASSCSGIRDAGAMRAAAVADEDELGPDEALELIRQQPTMEGQALVSAVSSVDAGRLQRGRPRAGGGRRLRRQDVDHAPAAAGGRRGDGVPARRRSGRARRLRRRPALERPRRPGAARRRGRGDSRPARAHERARDLPRAPAARPRDGPRDLQAPVRPSRRQPPGARAVDRPRPRDEPEPRLRGCADATTSEATLRLALRRHRRGLRLPRAQRALGAVPPRGRPGHARRLADPRALGRQAWSPPDAAAHRHLLDLPDRLRPDRDRPGLRVRLLRLPGAEGAARGRIPHDRRQLEPGHDHDRPGLRRPHLHRAARPPGRHRRAPPRAARRAPADARRPDGAQPRDRALRGGRPRRARSRADRRAAST